jgi:hypothetical protein
VILPRESGKAPHRSCDNDIVILAIIYCLLAMGQLRVLILTPHHEVGLVIIRPNY